jgi:hypothetical protein
MARACELLNETAPPVASICGTRGLAADTYGWTTLVLAVIFVIL